MLYVIILIQILIRYVKNLITTCTRSLDFDLKIEKSHSPRSVASLPRICHFSTRCPPMRWPTVRHWLGESSLAYQSPYHRLANDDCKSLKALADWAVNYAFSRGGGGEDVWVHEMAGVKGDVPNGRGPEPD